MSSELMGARGDEFKEHTALSISLEQEQEKNSFARTEGEINNVATSDYECDHLFQVWTAKPVVETDISSPTSREHISTDYSLIPDTSKLLDSSFIKERSSQTDEDSIGEDIQARFRVEQNTYFIPIKSDSELMHAAWDLAQENSIQTQGEDTGGQAIALGEDTDDQAYALEEYADDHAFSQGEYMDGQALTHGVDVDGCAFVEDESKLQWEEPPRTGALKRDTFQEYRHGRLDDLSCDSDTEEDASAFRNMKKTVTINIEGNGNNSSVGHKLSTHYYGNQHMHPRGEPCGDRNLKEDINAGSFPSREYPTKRNVELHFQASINMNNNGNTASSVPSNQARNGETLSKVAKEGVIILEKEPVQKKAPVDFVLFEGNAVYSLPKEAIIANTWMDYYTPSKADLSKLEVENKSNLVNNSLDQSAPKPELVYNSLDQTAPKPELVNNNLDQTAQKPDLVNNSLDQTAPKPELVNNSLDRTAPKPELVNNILDQTAPKPDLVNNILDQTAPKPDFKYSLSCMPKQCSSLPSAKPRKLKLQHMARSKKQINEMKAMRVCEKMNSPKFSASSHCPKFSPHSSKSRTFSPQSPKGRTSCLKSPKGRTSSLKSPKGRTSCLKSPRGRTSHLKSSNSRTFSPKSSKLRTISPKFPKTRTCSPNFSKIRKFNPKSPTIRSSSPKSPKTRTCSPNFSKIRKFNPKSPTIRSSSPKPTKIKTASPNSPKIKRSSPKSAKIRTFSPKSSRSKTFSPKTKTKYCSPRNQQNQSRRLSPTVKTNVSGNQEKIRPRKKISEHDHTGAKYTFHPHGISFNVKKAKSQTELNKSPSAKEVSSATSFTDRKKKAHRTATKKAQSKIKKESSAFPVSLHTFNDSCSVTPCDPPETTRQLTIETPKENFMVYTTYVRPNPFQQNTRDIFRLISQKHRLYLEDRERTVGSGQTRQLICETECFVSKDPFTKNLIIENGTVNELTPKVARSVSALKSKGKSLSGSKSEMSNTSKTSTSSKTEPKKHSWLDLQYVELIGDFVYIGRQKEEHSQKLTGGNKNSNAHCRSLSRENPCRCSYLIDTLDMDDCCFPQATEDGAGPSIGSKLCTSSRLDELHPSSHKQRTQSCNIKERDLPDSINWHLDVQCNRNNNSVEFSSDMEDTTLRDIEQIITEHPQLNSTKQKNRRSRPNSPSKRSTKGKCPECEPRIQGDVKDKLFIDFEHQVQPTDIEISDEVQTGSSLQLRTNLLPLRNKEIKRGHKLWNSCYCESPLPCMPVQYAECATQLNLDDVCCSEASQCGDVLEKTYTGHVVDIDYVTACDCQWKSKTTKKRHFDMQVCPEDICPSLKVQTGSSLLLLEPFVKGPSEDANSHEKKGHAYKEDTCKSPLPTHALESDFIETHEVETQVMATDINACTDAQTGDSLMLTEPFPPIRPTVSDEDYPEEDATWGDLSVQDMISENKSVYAYYKKYEDLTRLENDYEMYARPYKTASRSQQPADGIEIPQEPADINKGTGSYLGKEAQFEISAAPSFGRRSPSQRYIQPSDTGNFEENDYIRDHEQGEFRGIVKEKESKTVTTYQMETTSDPHLRGSWNPKYKLRLPQQTVLPEDQSLYDDNEDEVAKFEEEEESHRPYRRRRNPTRGPSIETQTFKSTKPDDEPVI